MKKFFNEEVSLNNAFFNGEIYSLNNIETIYYSFAEMEVVTIDPLGPVVRQ